MRIYSYSLRLRSKRGFASSKSNLFRKFGRGYITNFPSPRRKACCEKLSYKFSPRVNLHMERYKEDFGTDTWKVGQNRARGYAHCHPPSGWRAAMFHAGRRGFATRTISVAPRAIDAARNFVTGQHPSRDILRDGGGPLWLGWVRRCLSRHWSAIDPPFRLRPLVRYSSFYFNNEKRNLPRTGWRRGREFENPCWFLASAVLIEKYNKTRRYTFLKKRKEENRNIFTITEARRSRPFDDCFNSFFRFSPSPSFFLFSTILLSLLRTTVRRTKRGRRFLSPFFPKDYEPFCESLSLSTRVNELGRKWAEFYPRFYGAGLNREEGGGPLHRVFHGINFPFTGVFCCALWCSIYSLSLAYLFVCLSVFFFFRTREILAHSGIIIKQGSVEHLSSGGLIKLFRME